MASGLKDFHAAAAGSVINSGLNDVELNRRLLIAQGAPMSMFGGGEVIFADNFTNGLINWNDQSGAGSGLQTIVSAQGQVFNGIKALELTTGTGFNTYQLFNKKLAGYKPNRMGIECALYTPSQSDNTITITATAKENNSAVCTAALQIVTQTTLGSRLFKYQYGNNLFSSFETFGLYSVSTYVPLKLIVDFDAKKYVGFWLGNYKYYDLSAYVPFTGSPGSSGILPEFVIEFKFTNNASTGSRNLFVDNVIITQNEP